MSDLPKIQQKKSQVCPACNLYMLKRCSGGVQKDTGTNYYLEHWCGRCNRTESAGVHQVPSQEELEFDEWVKLNSLDKNLADMIKKQVL